ncbi:MAG: flagellar basal body P-ring formation chaperone FlgA [Candidatus Krumholzibacteriia bacterium]
MTRRLAFACLLAVSVATHAWGAEGGRLVLRARVDCGGPSLTLGDLLAQGSAGALDARRVAGSPAPGRSATLSKRRLERQLADWGWRGRVEGPDSLRLATPGVILDTRALRAAVGAELTTRLDSLGLRLDGESVDGWPEPLCCATSRVRWTLTLPPTPPRASGVARLSLEDAAGFASEVALRFRCARPVQVGVATLSQPRGATLSAWTLEERDAFAIDGEALDPAGLVGAQLREPLHPGDVITRRNVRPAPLVKSGREVEVRLVRGAVSVSLRGIARGDGALGDLVTVQPLDGGGAQRRYRVAGPGVVVPSYVPLSGGSS